MKKDYSPAWNSSRQARKQRKFRANAPLHKRHKFLSSHLSKELSAKYGKRSLPLRKGDEVLVMRGSFRKKKAKIASTDKKRRRVVLEGIQRSKKDGTKVNVFFDPSALMIISLGTEDKERTGALLKQQAGRKPAKENQGVN